MLEALGRADGPRTETAAAPPREEEFPLLVDDGEIPFIEVGGPAPRGGASPVVLSLPAAARLRLVPEPPGEAPPAFEPLPPASFPSAVAVAFRPLPLDRRLPPPAQRFAADLVAYHQPDHPASAQFRQLAAALRHGLKAGEAHAVLCAGLAPRVGTSCAVLNLAITYALQGVRTVIVDAHAVRPAVADRLGLRGRPGLAEVLRGAESLDRALQETGLENLTALTAGEADPLCPTPAVGEATRPVVRQLRDRFDLVLIDAPPYPEATDGRGLEAACDAAYVVLPRSDADNPEIEERIRRMAERGSPVRGCILTGR
jgi:Mrp family chromosome partitioning ATPase